jgi:phosphoribosylformylglycinamidine synthase
MELIDRKVIESAHDVSEGGLFITLLESCFNRELGVDVVANDYKIRKDGFWFGEAQSRIVVSVKATRLAHFKEAIGDHPYEELGEVTTGNMEIDGMNWGDIEDWKKKYDTAIESLLAPDAVDALTEI